MRVKKKGMYKIGGHWYSGKHVEEAMNVSSNIKDLEWQVAISALEKQIPKKWIDTKSYLTCPVCESFYDMPVVEKYCPNCGQRLKED